MTDRNYTVGGASPQKYGAYVPAVDDIALPPPPTAETTPQESANAQQTQAGLIVITVSNLFVTAIIVSVLLWNGSQAEEALARGTKYFTVTTPIYLVILTGTLTRVASRLMRELTERQRIKSYERVMVAAMEWRIRIEENRTLELQAQALPADVSRRLAQVEHAMLEREISAGGMQTPTVKNTFVPAYDNRSNAAFGAEVQTVDSTAQEALAWTRGLYLDTTGEPNPEQVHTTGEQVGWLRTRMLGSKRGTGSKEAGLWLLQRKVILRVPGGYKLNTDKFPRRESLRGLL